MSDIIKLLPDHIANQIAAGEVIQRPASVVKELLENSIDAGATKVRVIIDQAGKSLIQIIDNGSGMSPTDARMSLERHATSKIKEAGDLFEIKTKGFRGEALASIASVAQMELKTRQAHEEIGTRLLISASNIETQEPAACLVGTDISVKKLFFNIPARRKFLKSDTAEFRHIYLEFHRIAMAHPDVHLELHHNGKLMTQLPGETRLKRIVGVLGKNMKDKLIAIEEDTEIVKIQGYIGTAESARSRRDDQYFFINDRYFKSNYFSHAIASAYGNLLQDGRYPVFAFYLYANPDRIDVNVHPTKQEIKFEDERAIYNFIKTAVRHGLAKHHMIPLMDFEPEPAILRKSPGVFRDQPTEYRHGNQKSEPPSQGWESVFEGLKPNQDRTPQFEQTPLFDQPRVNTNSISFIFQSGGYIFRQIENGLAVIDQRSAHVRVLYELFLKRYRADKAAAQGLIFPITLELKPELAAVLEETISHFNQMGFDIAPFGGHTFILHAVPAIQNFVTVDENVFMDILKDLAQQVANDQSIEEKLALASAQRTAIRRNKALSKEESNQLVEQLFKCDLPDRTPTGQKCYITLTPSEIEKLFVKK